MYNPNIWWHFFQFIIFAFLVGIFIYKVFENFIRVNRVTFWVIIAGYIVITSLIIAATLTEISPHRELATAGINSVIVISIVLIMLLIQKNTFSLLFLFFLLLNIQYNTLTMAKSTLAFKQVPRIVSYEPGNILIIATVYCVVIFPVAYYLLVKLYKRVIEEKMASSGMKLFFLLPAGFFFAVYLFRGANDNLTSMELSKQLLPLVIINICAFGSYFAVLKSIIASHDAAIKHEKLYIAELRHELLEEECEHLQAQISSDARVRHDWKHHIITITGLVEHKDLDGLDEYLSEYREKYLVPDALPVCDVSALDMLFQYYIRKAAEAKVSLTISRISLEKCQTEVSDLIVVFGNLLANALEACERMAGGKRYITLQIKNCPSDLVGIVCENSFDGEIYKKNHKFISRKKKGGIGLSSIEAIAEQNNGMMKVEIQENAFKVCVALKR